MADTTLPTAASWWEERRKVLFNVAPKPARAKARPKKVKARKVAKIKKIAKKKKTAKAKKKVVKMKKIAKAKKTKKIKRK